MSLDIAARSQGDCRFAIGADLRRNALASSAEYRIYPSHGLCARCIATVACRIVDPYATCDTPCVRLHGVSSLEAAPAGSRGLGAYALARPAFPVRPRCRRNQRATLPATADCRQRTPVATHPPSGPQRAVRVVILWAGRPVVARVATGFWPLAWRFRSQGFLHPKSSGVPGRHPRRLAIALLDSAPAALQHPLGRVAFSPRPAAPVMGAFGTAGVGPGAARLGMRDLPLLGEGFQLL